MAADKGFALEELPPGEWFENREKSGSRYDVWKSGKARCELQKVGSRELENIKF